MSDAVIVGIIAAVGLIAATLVTSIISWQIAKLHTEQKELRKEQAIIKLEINGRMEQLLDLTRKVAEAKGDKQGREDLKHEQKDDAKIISEDNPIEVKVVNKEPIVVKIPPQDFDNDKLD